MIDPNTVVLAILAVSTAIKAYYDHKAQVDAAIQVRKVADAAAKAQDESKRRAEEVKITLEESNKANAEHHDKVEESLKIIKATSDDTHILVNNNMAIQLRMNAISARALADKTRDPMHIRLADEAERALAAHLEKQAIVDRNISERQEDEKK